MSGMHLTETQGALAYLAVLIAAFLEGEVTFSLASVAVGRGELDPIGVVLAGAAGAALGDQLVFYLLRGRLTRWIERFPVAAKRGARLTRRVRKNETLTVLAIRFSPG